VPNKTVLVAIRLVGVFGVALWLLWGILNNVQL
jgi:hypothetical protein